MWISQYWTCTNWPLKKNDPRLCEFIERSTWMGQVKIIRVGWLRNQLAQVGGPWIWRGRGSLWQAHLGDSEESSVLGCLPTAMGVRLPLSPKQCVLVGVTFTFPITCTTSSAYVLHLYHSFKSSNLVLPKNICTPTFIAALFTIPKIWKQPRYPLMDDWIKKLWYPHTQTQNGILFSHKKMEILPFVQQHGWAQRALR